MVIEFQVTWCCLY